VHGQRIAARYKGTPAGGEASGFKQPPSWRSDPGGLPRCPKAQRDCTVQDQQHRVERAHRPKPRLSLTRGSEASLRASGDRTANAEAAAGTTPPQSRVRDEPR
jgi:hypothetical protein